MNTNIKLKIKELTEKLNAWSYEYYVSNTPSVEDAVFDATLRELIELENQYPDLRDTNSPTMRVGGIVSSKFNKVKHQHPMLSLDNAFNSTDILRFANNIYDEADANIDFVIEPKIDGLSISVIYENAKLKCAVTRGDGVIGEDVTTNVKTIKDIPLIIDEKYKDLIIEVRGEIYIDKKDFNELNKNLDKKFSNPRNAAAGSIRNLDSSIAASRNLKAFMYNLPNPVQLGLSTQTECLNWLKSNGFKVSDLSKCFNNVEDINEYILDITDIRGDLSFDIDGLVIKLNQIKYYDNLGNTSKFPKWAIAYKFPANIVVTKIIDIILNVGRTGKISYIAKLEPIQLDGSIISFATLHNYEFIKTKNIKIGSNIEIYKAGDVIPYVKGIVDSNTQTNLIEFSKPTLCPSCNSTLVLFEGIQDLYCVNKQCEEKKKRNIEYFTSRNIMNIEGLSYAIISKLYDSKLISTEWDLYSIKNKKEEIIDLNINIKDKSFNNLINAIETSRNVSLERIIASFGIKNVGATTAKLLAKKFKDLNSLSKATYEELVSLHVIGEITANEIIKYFKSEEWLITKSKIEEFNINTIYIEEKKANQDKLLEISNLEQNQVYKNKTFVITGTFSIPRDAIKSILEDLYNCKVSNSVTKKTDYLLAGNDGGSKLNKAKELGIKIIDTEFWINN
ncbi:MAG: NAD-dependent DNA ligase LigA [Mycoplasma sp.]